MALEFPAVPLHRYAARIGYTEWAFFGLNHPDNPRYACREVWTQPQRDMVEWALLEAQEEIEAELRYTLVPKWQAAERHPATCPVRTQWGKVLAAGVMADTVIEAGVAVDYAADPATVVVDLGSHAPEDVHLFLPGTDLEVTPTGRTGPGSTGVATYSIPWARLVAWDYRHNPPEGWLYADVATWGTAALDVRAVENDPSTQGVLLSREVCGLCGSIEEAACLRIERGDVGVLTWERTETCASHRPEWIELHYLAGMMPLTRQAEDTVIRLAHAKMPEEPCGCEVAQRLWRRDRHVPEVLTRERINCPYGLSDGAWQAWRFTQSMKLVRGRVL